MSVNSAVLWLVLAVSVVNLGLSMVVLRSLAVRSSLGPLAEPDARAARPSAGFELSLDGPEEWSPGADRLLQGTVWVALVVPGCKGCAILREEFALDRDPHPPLVVIADYMPNPGESADYLETTWDISDLALVAPNHLERVAGLGNPDEFPVVLEARDGVVVASAHRLSRLRATLLEGAVAGARS